MFNKENKLKVGMKVFPKTARQGYLKSSYVEANTPIVINEIKELEDGSLTYKCGFHNYEYREDELSRKKWKDIQN